VSEADIIAKICAALPDARVTLEDLTGTADHWRATVISQAFAGKTALERHRMVMAALAEELKGAIHALTLDVRTPDESHDLASQ
jgi:stress-induced morphogen